MLLKSLEGNKTSISTFSCISKIKFSTRDSRLTLTFGQNAFLEEFECACVYVWYVRRTCCLTLTVITQVFNGSQHQIQHVNTIFVLKIDNAMWRRESKWLQRTESRKLLENHWQTLKHRWPKFSRLHKNI